MVIAAIGTVLAAAYLLWLYQRTAFGEPTEEFAGHDGRPAHAVGRRRQRIAGTTTITATRHPRRRRSPSGSPGRRCSSASSCSASTRSCVQVIDPAVNVARRRRSARPRPVISPILAQAGDFARADDRLPRARARDRARRGDLRRARSSTSSSTRRRSGSTATLAGFGLLGAFVPIVTLAVVGDDVRSMFGGALRRRRLLARAEGAVPPDRLRRGAAVARPSIEEGGYYQGEYYVLLLTSVLGMVMMASSRDLVSIFVALEFLSIPAYMLAAWRKRDRKSNEAGVKYFLLGVFASAVMLYGM